MKPIKIYLLFFFINTQSLGQFKPFNIDPKEDSVWIQQLLAQQKNNQSEQERKELTWLNGKVLYSPDRYLKIGQIVAADNNADLHFTATIQYTYQDKIIEQKLTDKFTFQFNPIRFIYKMPDKEPYYLVVGISYEETSDKIYDWIDDFLSKTVDPSKQDMHGIKLINNEANLISLTKDSLQISDSSVEFSSLTKSAPLCPEPFFSYDTLKNQLNFLRLYCDDDYPDNNCSTPFIRIHSGTYKYSDNAFKLINDSLWFYPSLESFTDTFLTKKYKVGIYEINTVVVKSYEEVGEGIVPVQKISYKINDQTFEEFDDVLEDTLKYIKPDCRFQKDSSLILLTTDIVNYYSKGMCGACEFDNYEFSFVKNNHSGKIFSVSDNTGSGYTTYGYGDNTSAGEFYLYKDSTVGMVDSAYWKNNNTYVFRKSDDSFFRDFYIHFTKDKGRIIARLTIGELIKCHSQRK